MFCVFYRFFLWCLSSSVMIPSCFLVILTSRLFPSTPALHLPVFFQPSPLFLLFFPLIMLTSVSAPAPLSLVSLVCINVQSSSGHLLCLPVPGVPVAFLALPFILNQTSTMLPALSSIRVQLISCRVTNQANSNIKSKIC